MKKTLHSKIWATILALVMLFALLPTAFAADGDVEINATNFPDAIFREYVKEFDNDKNGALSASELGKVTVIRVSEKGISSLNGIQYFTELTSLSCSNNNLTSLDVSRNTRLTELDCSNNRLTSLDVSNNTRLTYLDCSYGNRTSLDVSYITALKPLIYFSKDSGSTPITAVVIDKTNFPDSAFREYVKQFDTDKDGALSASELAAVTKIDVNRKGISSLKGVEHFTALTELYCEGNRLTSLDVSENPALTTLRYSGNASGFKLIETKTEYVNIVHELREALDNDVNPASYLKMAESDLLRFGDTSCFQSQEDYEAFRNDIQSIKEFKNLKTDRDKIYAVYRYMAENFYYDYYALNSGERYSDERYSDYYYLWKQKRGVCEDYSSLSWLILTELNVPCFVIVTIPSDKGAHAYNAAYDSDAKRWIFFDSTWASGNSIDAETNLKIDGSFNDNYFDLDDNFMSIARKNHRPSGVPIMTDDSVFFLNTNRFDGPMYVSYVGPLDSEVKDLVIPSVSPIKNHPYNNITLNTLYGWIPETVESVTIPDNITSIYYCVFFYKCNKLKNVTILGRLTIESVASIEGKTDSGVAIDATNFPDEIFREYVKQFDTDKDGVLSPQERWTVTTIDVSYKGISSLKGIERFPNLTTLSCGGNNNLTSLDVSKCTALTDLYCYDNSSLTLLDVRGCTALQTLWCSGNNNLTSLDVSKCTALKYLYCYNNDLTSLDVSGNPALKYLSCYNNDLTSLDVRKNPALETLYCYNNDLTSLDVSNNHALRSLSCYGNAYKIDVDKDKAFSTDKLPGGFNIQKASAWVNATVNGNTITVIDTLNPVTYKYDIGNGAFTSPTFTLNVTEIGGGSKTDSDVAIDETNFPDSAFREYVKQFDTDKDGALSEKETAAVTRISLNGKGIASIKGIEYFTALEELYCYNNNLKSLDVSKCTALEYLDCYNNYNLTELNVSGNPALKYLYCYNNDLTSLDVSKNTALIDLWCSNNDLTELDVSKNTALETLWCYDNNDLTSLDVSKNTALIDLWCSNNDLTELDVSKNTALETLWCYDNNNLKSLDVSGCTALETLTCYNNDLTELDVSKNTALVDLECYNNNLTSLDVSNNPALTDLYCDNNYNLTELDVSGNPALKRLSCYGNNLTSLDVSNNPALKYLYCRDNVYKINVDKDNAFSTDKLPGGFDIQKASAWTNATVNGNTITVIDTSKPVTYKYDIGNSTFTSPTFTLNVDKISGGGTDSGAVIDETNFPDSVFREYVKQFDTDKNGSLSEKETAAVTRISLNGKGIASVKGIEYFTELKELFCENNQITELDMRQNTKLIALFCQTNKLTSINVTGLTSLEYLTCQNNQLTELSVSGNPALQTLYCYNNNLTSLDVSNNPVLNTLKTDSNVTLY